MVHPGLIVAYVDEHKGHGLFARVFIPAGTVVLVADRLDQRIGPDDPRLADPRYAALIRTYGYREGDSAGVIVLPWDEDRHVNHCCVPTVGWAGGPCDVALVDLHPGMEVTSDYRRFTAGGAVDPRYACARGDCPLRTGAAEAWPGESLAPAAVLARIPAVPQPLRRWVDDWDRLFPGGDHA